MTEPFGSTRISGQPPAPPQLDQTSGNYIFPSWVQQTNGLPSQFTGSGYKPQYKYGAQFAPRKLSDRQINDYKTKLYNSGFFTNEAAAASAQYSGRWSTADAAAYEDALGEANMQGVTVEELFSQRSSNPDLQKALSQMRSGPAKAPKRVLLTNPDDIHAAVKAAAKQELGYELPDDAMGQAVSEYQSMERGIQLADAGGTSPPSMQTFAENQARAADPTAAAAHDITNQFSSFLNILKGVGLGDTGYNGE